MRLAIEQFNQSHQVKNAIDSSSGIVDTAFAVYYYDYVQEQYRPAFQIQLTSKNGAYSENIFISAATGRFLGAENLICTINFPGTAQSRYSGTRNIVADAPTAAGPFRLQETRGANNVLIRTRNMNHQTNLSNVTEFFDNNNTWTVAEHGADQAAFDAHWGAETVHDYWLNIHNRNSINGSGMAIEGYVHLGTNVFNARWVSGLNVIQYGDGVVGTNPLTSLDICAHEFGHGIDQFTGDLLYERESGALDEGFADIWGACIEAWAKPGGNRWLMGEEVLSGPIRNMSNPNAFGQPDTYLGTNWVNQVGCIPSFDPISGNDGCGVHTNSGILNFWFFLLSEGGTGTNDNSNSYNVTGLGITTAADIAYATKLLAGGTTNFTSCRSLSIQAASILYGANSCEVKAVTDAWHAVGVGSAYTGNLGLVINGDDNFCTVSNFYSIANLPAGATVSWSTFPVGAVFIGTPNSTTTTLTKSADGLFILKAIVTDVCGDPNATVKIQKSVIAGPPPAEIRGPYDPQQHTIMGVMCTGDPYYFTAYDSESGSSYTWTLFPPAEYTTLFPTLYSGSPVYMSADSAGIWTLRLAKSNTCGTTITTKYLDVQECLDFFAIIAYPNPAKGNIKVTIRQNDAKSSNTLTGNVLIELYNFNTAARQKQWTFADVQSHYDLNIAQVPKGIYILRVSVAGRQQSAKLVVE